MSGPFGVSTERVTSMAKRKVIGFGAVGPGGVGRARTVELGRHKAFKIVAAADTSRKNIRLLENALGYKVKAFGGPKGYRDMIDRVPMDAVGIFSPHTLHYEQVKYALRKGKHVLIEKPMVCGAGKAVETAKLAAEKGLVYLIHYQRHFMPMYIKAKEMIDKGMIGNVKSFYVYMAQDWSGVSWRGDPKYSGGGQINDSGSHYQDILLWMTGLLPKSVDGDIDYYYRGEKKRVQMNGSFMVELSNGAAGRLIIMSDIVGGFVDDVRIMGTKATISFAGGFSGGSVVLQKHGSRTPKIITPKLPKGYPSSACDNFAKLLTGQTEKNYVSAVFGARVALLTESLLLSAKTGKRVYCDRLLRKDGYTMRDLRIK